MDAAKGTKIWSYTTGSPVESFPSIANGVLYIGSDDINFYAFGSITVPQPSPPLPSPPPSHTTPPSSTPSTNQKIFPVALIATVFVVIVAVAVGVGLLLYFRKRRK